MTATGHEFDAYAEDYDAVLGRGLSASGEDKDFFARGRLRFLASCLRAQGTTPRSVLDFGCGTGSSAPHFFAELGATAVLGVDVSERSLDIARRKHGSDSVHFSTIAGATPGNDRDLVFCNGIFHHIPPHERADSIDYIRRSLRRGGVFALWENNPWNPGTRLVMRRIPFDRDAMMLSAPRATRLVRDGGFEVLAVDYMFIFPRALRWLRPLETRVSNLPLGAQYQVLCRRA